MEPLFQALPKVPDHPALEHEILAWWDEERVFERLREQNAGNEPWSFVDGPITANNPMGVHHCWGRSLKDLYQRYKAMRGHDLRYQNGFDCQGLHVEVEVERSLGLNSKREIEAYGIAEFARRCRERVAHYAGVITDQSRRLGMWMDWEKSYFTFSDTNIEYIWRFLKVAHERGWLYRGHRATEWCPRCGTSISQHELTGAEAYAELVHPSLTVRLPLQDRPEEALAVWTTTPWTLPANVAAAVNPEAEYGLLDGTWSAVAGRPDAPYRERRRGAELVGLRYEPPFPELDAQAGVDHVVIPWDEVAVAEGTGIVHIAPGAGGEDFELSRVHGLPVLAPVDEDGRFVAGYGPFTGLATDEAQEPIVGALRERGLLVAAEEIPHRYPICWRCATPLITRIADDWFISAAEVRQPMLDANATVEWTPSFYSKRMDDWLRNMGDWNISRRRYFGLPLPIYPCSGCDTVNVVGSLAELRERAVRGLDQLEELHRPWIDEVTIRCEGCDAEVQRIPEVGDAWLDAGIVGFSTLGWQNPRFVPGGYATGASAELSTADLPDHAYWERWFPADWQSEMREQIRLWFYSELFMSVTLFGGAPYRQLLAFEKLRDETGREMHKSWGNAIEANEAMERMGADVMRFMYAAHTPHHNLNFGYGPANEVKRRLLTLWNSIKFFADYANIESFRPTLEDLERGPSDVELEPLDEWLLARARSLVAAASEAYERFWSPDATRAFESFVDDLSNWYIRVSRRRFYGLDEAAFRTLWHALVTAARVIAPVMPFLSDFVWRTLVSGAIPEAPRSVFLAGWPEAAPRAEDRAILLEVDEARRVVELGRQARAQANVKLRQPLRRMVVQGAEGAGGFAELIRNELRVKTLDFGELEAVKQSVKPNLRTLGPRLGNELPAVREALRRGEFHALADGRYRVGAHVLEPGEVLVEEAAREGWAVVSADGLVVGLETELDEELVREGRLLELVHAVNLLRKESGFEVTDPIVLTVPEESADLLVYEDFVKQEALAVSIDVGGGLAVRLAQPEPAASGVEEASDASGSPA
ncbi:MAG: isoleucine--tRNA ligase [Actinomycetota bacterium]|nr:isoleucine--tRNA ligase [Actinomycetota bacterium]